MRTRIRGICTLVVKGEADDEDPEMLTIEKIEKDAPGALEPLPPDQGLAVALSYEKGTQERKGKPTARGEKHGSQDRVKQSVDTNKNADGHKTQSEHNQGRN